MPQNRSSLVSAHRVRGSDLRCWTYPSVGPSSGILLAVHGFRGDHHGLQLLVDQLPEYTVVVPDLPGFGASTPMAATAHDVPGYSAVVADLAKELGLGPRTTLLGHSFGSIVAAFHLAAHPGSFERMVLINPICEPALEGSHALMSRAAAAFYAAGALLPESTGERLLRSRIVSDLMSATMTKSSDHAVRAYVKDQHRRYFGRFSGRDTLREAFGASITGTVRQVAPAIGAPTLLVAGALDELGSPAGQEALAAEFPAAELRVIDGVGHLIHYERPAAAAGHIRAFLAS
ncbi:alpha/beta fold hydrolase [Arthrobacter halodurans]|uniref:Alpha/beta fold hydrolase n=1 Tax=Arthrobacter halodurans TaxID=516699 RepID=A0ABV4UL15_9MICC